VAKGQLTPEQREWQRAYRARQKALAAEANRAGVHFSATVSVGVGAYQLGCRCAGCKAAMSGYAKRSSSYKKHRRKHGERLKADPEYRAKYRAVTRDWMRAALADPEYRAQEYARQAKRARAIRDEIDALKVSRGCVDCGWGASAVALDFDHIESGKRFTVAQAVLRSKKLRDAELARCQVVCCNCHRLRTAKRRGPTKTHDWRQRWLTRRRERLAEMKTAAGCADCGYNTHAEALDFDHVRGEKSFSISKGAYKAWGVIMAEVAKCEVYCARCHRIRTHETKVSGHRRKT
jgi:hypothetical protein